MNEQISRRSQFFSPQGFFRVPTKRNQKPLKVGDAKSLVALFAPAILVVAGLKLLYQSDPRFSWLAAPLSYPFELYVMCVCGTLATVGGVGDWWYHRVYVTAGPNERKSHLLALATGGFPLALLMCWASVLPDPRNLLIPILVVVLYTTVLICLDEFLFHWKRCLPFETLMHRILVLGNGVAWLAWMHWCFVRGGAGGL